MQVLRMCALLALAACGRLGFEDHGDGGVPDESGVGARVCGPWREPELKLFDNVNRVGRIEWAAQVSRDGLDVMYASDRYDPEDGRPEDKRMSIFTAHRDTRTQPFGAPKYLKQVNDGQLSAGDPSLWDARRELYFVDRYMGTQTCVYVSQLDADLQDGTKPVHLEDLCFEGSDYIQGIWISDDGNRLYYQTNKTPLDPTTRHAWVATRDATTGTFKQPHRELPELAGMGYCTLEVDEKTIYCERSETYTDIWIWQATRRSLDAPFDHIERVPERASQNHDGDPSVTADGKLMIFASGLSPDADLFALERDCTESR